jgi:hypothetical protein
LPPELKKNFLARIEDPAFRLTDEGMEKNLNYWVAGTSNS